MRCSREQEQESSQAKRSLYFSATRPPNQVTGSCLHWAACAPSSHLKMSLAFPFRTSQGIRSLSACRPASVDWHNVSSSMRGSFRAQKDGRFCDLLRLAPPALRDRRQHRCLGTSVERRYSVGRERTYQPDVGSPPVITTTLPVMSSNFPPGLSILNSSENAVYTVGLSGLAHAVQ
jgi:hypothetical protein